MNNEIRAKGFAAIAHGGQVYDNEMPYTFHLDEVVDVLYRFGIYDSLFICAGYLHDVIEDTRCSYSDVNERFGEDVAEIVYAVSNELGRNRAERSEKTYPKIMATPGAIVVKLADRIANVQHGLARNGKHKMYKSEFQKFARSLYEAPSGPLVSRETTVAMWNFLARLLGEDLEKILKESE